jgi:hypothetical protein
MDLDKDGKKDEFFKVRGGADSGVQNTTASPEITPAQARQILIDLVEASGDKHFVFLFGSPASGKTAALAAMLHAMHQPDAPGKLYIHGVGEGFFAEGLALWSRIQKAFSQRRFPPRSATGTTIQLHAEFRSHAANGNTMDLVFLEIAGDDLQQVVISAQGNRSLPFHIGQFLRIPTLKIAFIITTSWEDASKDDPIIDSFISHINEQSPHLIDNRFILLVTKWDTRRGNKKEEIDTFVRRTMPQTYNKLSSRHNIIQPFSVGTIIPFAEDGKSHPDDIIDQFDHAASQRLFERIFQTFTGHTLTAKPSLWDRLKSGLKG